MYARLEEADALVTSLSTDKDPVLRRSGMYTLAMAYCGTGSNKAIRKLLHIAVCISPSCQAKSIILFDWTEPFQHFIDASLNNVRFQVSDVNDDVRRAAVTSIGFILFRWVLDWTRKLSHKTAHVVDAVGFAYT